jgi:DNA-binding transcriptional regulator YiaG
VGEASSNRVISLASSRHISRVSERALSLSILRSPDDQARVHLLEAPLITGLVVRRSLAVPRGEWHCVGVNELRELRRNAHVTQQELADLLKIPVNTFRMWDSGLRRPSAPIVARVRDALARQAQRRQLLPLADLAKELGVHVRTLQAAARTGRLETQFSVRSVFGRPMRFASRAAGEQFIARHYRCFSGQKICPAPLPTVPGDYDKRLRDVRRRRGLTQDALARRIGAAGKAVVYQWESRKRTPSPVLWRRFLELETRPAAR